MINEIPVGLKEIHDVYGTCIYLETSVEPTLDQKLGGDIDFYDSCNFCMLIIVLGWIITLNSEIEDEQLNWHVHLGRPRQEHPSYSTSLTYDFVNLRPNTYTFISFEKEHVNKLHKRGLLQPKEYCHHITLHEAIQCYKKYFLRFFQVIKFLIHSLNNIRIS